MQILISLGFGFLVGAAYGLVDIKSPAPPIVALFGLLGMVLGERSVTQLRERMGPPAIASADTGADNRSRPSQPR